jgi:hypothetical protein
MLDQTQTIDPFDSASDPVLPTYDLFGKAEISAWACALVKGQGKMPFDPAVHEKRFTAIDIFIQPLAEIDVKYPKSLEDHPIAESKEWAQITLASIKALGINNVREVNGMWARVTKVPNGKHYVNKDGDKRDETTFKFVEFYADEDACRAAYLAAGGQPGNGNGHNVPVATSENAEQLQALNVMKVVINNVAPGKTTFAEVQEAIKAHVFYPHVVKWYPVESVEVGELITESTKLLPF